VKTEELIRQETEDILRRLDGNIEALILLGSFARGEGIGGLSDIEFLGVVKNSKDIQKKETKNITVKFTTANRLKRLKPYIFTLELKKYGKVLHGNKKVLDLIPGYTYDDIEPMDGFVLLNNRIVEQLILLQRIKSRESVNQYDFDKGYIQIVNSYLAFNKRYKSLYPEKREQFNRLYIGNSILKDRVNDAFSSIKGSQASKIGPREALNQWQELRKFFQEMWLYEAKVLCRHSTPNSILSLPGLAGRIKGWLKVMISQERRRLFSWKEVIRWFFITSPQYLIYSDAASLYFSDDIDMEKLDKVIEKWKTFVK